MKEWSFLFGWIIYHFYPNARLQEGTNAVMREKVEFSTIGANGLTSEFTDLKDVEASLPCSFLLEVQEDSALYREEH